MPGSAALLVEQVKPKKLSGQSPSPAKGLRLGTVLNPSGLQDQFWLQVTGIGIAPIGNVCQPLPPSPLGVPLGGIGNDQLAADAVTTDKILDGAVTAAEVLQALYRIPTQGNGRRSLQLSFASKLMHTLDPHRPMYDRRGVRTLGGPRWVPPRPEPVAPRVGRGRGRRADWYRESLFALPARRCERRAIKANSGSANERTLTLTL